MYALNLIKECLKLKVYLIYFQNKKKSLTYLKISGCVC